MQLNAGLNFNGVPYTFCYSCSLVKYDNLIPRCNGQRIVFGIKFAGLSLSLDWDWDCDCDCDCDCSKGRMVGCVFLYR